MKPTRRVSRRSFLVRVAGGALIGGAALTVLGGEAGAVQGVTDSDSGPGADPRGRGRGALTDSDSGPNADRPGKGRGPRRTSCAANQRRAADHDSGPNADAASCGRGPRRN
ncbi:MAG TPA: hypothetical protein VGO55_13020 [Allosphingosinicella sp.]|jgi:hypothetical protein|nr:hypothetical protein [Allosphingosinicella sp.]